MPTELRILALGALLPFAYIFIAVTVQNGAILIRAQAEDRRCRRTNSQQSQVPG